MAFLDSIIGLDKIREQQDISDDIARERYDPSILSPEVSRSREVAARGIPDEQIRANTLRSLFPSSNIKNIGGSAGRQLSFMQKLDESKMSNLAEAESRISLKDEQVKQQARDKVASLLSKQRQIESERDAKVLENRLIAESEAERRKKQFGASIGKLAGTVAGSFLGPVGASLGGAIGGAAFGGGSTGIVSGGLTGALTSVGLGALESGGVKEDGEETKQKSLLDLLGFNKKKESTAANVAFGGGSTGIVSGGLAGALPSVGLGALESGFN